MHDFLIDEAGQKHIIAQVGTSQLEQKPAHTRRLRGRQLPGR